VWTRKEFQRTTGTTKGVIDKYWFTPVTQKRLRISFKDVQRFLASLELADGDEDAAMLSMKQGGGDHADVVVEDVNMNVNVNHANITPMSYCSPHKNVITSQVSRYITLSQSSQGHLSCWIWRGPRLLRRRRNMTGRNKTPNYKEWSHTS
jgi:hypothetical protein